MVSARLASCAIVATAVVVLRILVVCSQAFKWRIRNVVLVCHYGRITIAIWAISKKIICATLRVLSHR